MTNRNNKTILLVGGGTGGHIVPILHLRQELLRRDNNLTVLTVGGISEIDQKLYAGLSNHISLRTGKLHRAVTAGNLIQLFLLCWGIFSSFALLAKNKPSLIFSKAGYVSLPIIFWARILKIPYFIHESDIEMGAANKFAARAAEKIFVGFPIENYPSIAKERMEFVGQILRPNIFANKDAKSFDFEFNNNKPIIFITGGSQGSRNINKAIFEIIDDILCDYNLIHHIGSLDYEKAIEVRASLKNELKQSYFISPLLTKTKNNIDLMESAILQSSLVICRASATTLSEVSVAKKPIITIPYKYAAGNHQTKNAMYYKKNRAAMVISDDKLNGAALKKQIIDLFSQPMTMKETGEAAYRLQLVDGLSKVTDEIENFNDRKCDKI